MRIKLVFSLSQGTSLPLNYNYYLTSAIYQILASSSPRFSRHLHEKGFFLEGKKFKLFTYSQLLLDKKRIEADRMINLGRGLSWLISSPVKEFIEYFVDGLFKKGKILINHRPLILEKVETLPEPDFGPTNYFTCLSPLTFSTVMEKEGKKILHYYRIGEEGFIQGIKNNLCRKYYLLQGRDPADDQFELEFDSHYLAVHPKVSRLVDFKGIKIKGYMAPFRAKGSVELIKVGYECGFGDKNSAGFGMVKLIKGKEKNIKI